MVKIVSVERRVNKNNEPFWALNVESGLELIQSKQSGMFYATSKKSSIPSTFSEVTAKGLIGSQIPGSIVRVTVPEYEFTIPSTGEVITLNHRWSYTPESESVTEVILQKELMEEVTF